MAAAQAGRSLASFQDWLRRSPELAEAYAFCSSVGMALTLEQELYRRALAGKDDRGSMQALLAVIKNRDPEYRDKSQPQVLIVGQAEQARSALVDGWDGRRAIDSPSSERS